MAPRPAGTDGSDAAFRMVVADRYQAMADLRGLIGRLRKCHVVLLGLKLLWLAIGLPQGITYPLHMPFMAVAEVLGIALYNQAQVGLAKESIGKLKLFNLVQAGLAAAQLLSGFAYHSGSSLPSQGAQVKYSDLWVKASLDNGVPISAGTLQRALTVFELFMDITLAAVLLLATFMTQKYILMKIETNKERSAAGTAKKADGPAAGAAVKAAVAAAGDDSDEDEDASRPTAAASARTRSRRRMA